MNKQKIWLKYLPHGHPINIFKPIDENDTQYINFIKEFFKGERNKYNFIALYNNRNIKRKMTSDTMLAFATFVRSLPKEDQKKCIIILHTHPVDDNGTDLLAVYHDLMSDINMKFSDQKYSSEVLNYIYNAADVTVTISSNEGYGISTAESLMASTPIIANVQGGLQDQQGFKKPFNTDAYWWDEDLPKSGDWVYSVFPKTRSLQGSPPTPYIFDSRCDWHDVVKGFEYWYNMSRKERKEKGLLGRQYLIDNEHTVDKMVEQFDIIFKEVFKNWTPIPRFVIDQI